MGRDERVNGQRRAAELAEYERKMSEARDAAVPALTKALGVLTGAAGITVLLTEETTDEQGQPSVQTRHYTACMWGKPMQIAHLRQGAEILYQTAEREQAELDRIVTEARAKAAEALPFPGTDEPRPGPGGVILDTADEEKPDGD